MSLKQVADDGLRNSIDLPLFVLCGGFGTRLKPVVNDVPKALAPIKDKPFLGFLMDNWVRQGLRKFVFLLHYQAKAIAEFLAAYQDQLASASIHISFVVEPEPLDTGGAVAFGISERKIQGDFLLANSDTWLEGGIAELANSQAPCLLAVAIDGAQRFGSLRIEDGLVVSFEEKASRANFSWINAGSYLLHTDHFSERGPLEKFSLERQILEGLAEQNKLRAIQLESDFLDIGVPDDYRLFCAWKDQGLI